MEKYILVVVYCIGVAIAASAYINSIKDDEYLVRFIVSMIAILVWPLTATGLGYVKLVNLIDSKVKEA